MNESREKRRLQLGVQISIWLLLVLAYALVFIRFIPFQDSLWRALGNILPILFLFYGNMFLVKRYFIPKSYVIYALWMILVFTLITGIRTQINIHYIDYKIDFLPQTNQAFLRTAAIISNMAVILISTIYQLLIHRSAEEKKALITANEHQQAQIQFLRAQINPHFLFNTLNNIYSLAVVQSTQTAPMVLQLSELLRYVIYDSQEEKVPLRKEVVQINRFIELFQMRQETPVNIEFHHAAIPEQLKIEPMILIPLVENCFKHCDFDANSSAFVQIKLEINEHQLVFSTQNSKNDANQQKDKTGGVGLQNIKKRLALKYAERHHLAIKNEDELFSVKLDLQL